MIKNVVVSDNDNRNDMIRKVYVKKKRKNKVDYCNICGKILPLTWDHVPPEFCFNDGKVKYNSMMDFYNKEHRKDISQNGIKFRTLCSNCNNTILGRNYDVEFKKLVDCLYDIYITPGEMAQYVILQGLKVNKIVRSIVGHLLAAREDFNNKKLENDLRSFLLDESSLPPKDFKLLYYTYPYNTVMIIRDVVPVKIGNPEYKVPNSLLSCLNTFPLAFILVNKCDDTCGLYDMFSLCTNNIDDVVDIKIDLLSYLFSNHKESRHPFWPCNVSDDESGVSAVLTTEVAQNNSVLSDIRSMKKR